MQSSAHRTPAVLIAAPASGQGKTTLTAALARLLTRRGHRVRVFKCGPDFLDPYWHQLASGAPVYQLDLWMTGEQDCRQRLAQAAQEADVVLVEGVMGLFDGTPSAADLAVMLGLPVLAVVDAGSMAGTFGALAFGLQHYRSGMPWAGVLANRAASAGHADMLRTSLRDPAQWLGALPRDAAFALPERHLGLTVATELPDALQRLDAAADALAQTELGRMSLQDWQRWAVDLALPVTSAMPATELAAAPLLRGQRIAVARDSALCFIYQANLDTLAQLGAEVVFFSPLHDAHLPACDAVWLPGGYPELHAAQLAANTSLRDDMAVHIAAHKPVWAECGGMMLLFESVQQTDGSTQPLWGLLPGQVVMQQRLAGLGPQQLQWSVGSGEGGGDGAVHTLRGHTFHYSRTETPLPPTTYTTRPGTNATSAARTEALWQQGSVRASYFHAWFASSPAATAALLGAEAMEAA
ncbi:cobyrinate a,c-diamide synthase [Curvibacter sp. CHRR-16]|uniref:cobyrinate a,c-diamide synthase n=1 Tax=Curvibacter sp. CHRR-16 TaxID=2835872 RepID=UPI001BDAD572|nr:cobyrinate a,c-diamide synthase [Curvibacter sp. CHRR-16]MBT0569214.1 cobyrinate a,c-diamide synthase [Curvibacter sp. CHRR-16]